ncbi:Sterile alpha motif type 2 [Penicillium robsamsonii]|uniref:Sterile alpha motif type 2 n=1 Tax=Penicillium robsamsonii TaxID=1792511 RepID=UPI0025488F6D|nr:Sterile alpha motif type 2 [Penicillium robsamsonii]KAJ5834688.1 Sterile alpha motif type 2 [Penicillium robsamsonii]
MSSQVEYIPTLEYPAGKECRSFSAPREIGSNTYSEYTDILDTDFDSDSQSESGEDSSHRSVRSFGSASVTTASTPDDVKTPCSTGLTAFHFHIDENPVAGPTGPHLFGLSDGMEIKSSVEVDLIYEDTPGSATTTLYPAASKLGPYRRDTPVPSRSEKVNSQNYTPDVILHSAPTQPDEGNVSSWTPQDVVEWMQKRNVAQEIVEKFFINDISGSILLELQPEDLKELDISSFGKRHTLMNSIRELRERVSVSYKELPPIPPPEHISREATPQSAMADVGVTCTSTPVAYDEESARKDREYLFQQQQKHRRRRGARVLGPEDSVSIVGIEQVLPRLHRCSKGEDCRKWLKQHAKLSRMVRDLPIESLGSSMVITGDPGNAATARNLAKPSKLEPKSDVTPSIVASSDALGPVQPNNLPLSQDKLHDVQPRDAQENVRNFLNFQRLSRLRPVNDPSTPPRDTFPSPGSDSPGTLAENLRSLPRLRIPSSYDTVGGSALSPPALSGQRTITPSVVHRKRPFQSHIPEVSTVSQDSVFSPSDYYRQDPHYEQSTPFSEMDVPLTAIQLGPIERNISQSVPPDMRFGHYQYPTTDPIYRPRSTKLDNHRKKPSFVSNITPVLTRLDEGRMMEPIETPEDLDRTPRAGHCRPNPFSPTGEPNTDIIHAGWMKKRKNARFLRHEWQDHHFALRGTQLAMYTNEEDSQQVAKALEYIDVDDYAVACSSLASSSKLTAAFKKTVLKRTDDTRGDTAFAFSLIPSPSSSNYERKTIFTNGSKAHHFAVKTRDERIDWMRELMLAKALRRGRESGASLNVNGAPF